jgi:hypothetical protein
MNSFSPERAGGKSIAPLLHLCDENHGFSPSRAYKSFPLGYIVGFGVHHIER